MKPVKFVLMLPVTFIGLLVVALIFTVLNKAFWDARVRYLCAHEGGVTVYETVDLSAPEYADIATDINGIPFIPFDSYRDTDDLLYRVSSSELTQKFGGIEIARRVGSIVRSTDDMTLSTNVSFSRRGGDFVTFGAPGSSFSCGDLNDGRPELEIQTFNLQGEQ